MWVWKMNYVLKGLNAPHHTRALSNRCSWVMKWLIIQPKISLPNFTHFLLSSSTLLPFLPSLSCIISLPVLSQHPLFPPYFLSSSSNVTPFSLLFCHSSSQFHFPFTIYTLYSLPLSLSPSLFSLLSNPILSLFLPSLSWTLSLRFLRYHPWLPPNDK